MRRTRRGAPEQHRAALVGALAAVVLAGTAACSGAPLDAGRVAATPSAAGVTTEPPAPSTTGAPTPAPTTASPTATVGPTPTTSPSPEPTRIGEPTPAPSTPPAPEPTPSPSPEPAQSPEPTQSPAPQASEPASEPAAPVALRAGDDGATVEQAQQRLADLGYWLGDADGTYGPLTEQAVMALQGAAGLQRDGVLGPNTQAALDEGVRPSAETSQGQVVEIDRDAGLVMFVDDGDVELALHTSTGTFENYTNPAGEVRLADTPGGTFEVTWAQDGWTESSLGRLYRPRYFHPDGIALHGSSSIPGYPASHGCARVSVQAMDMVWSQDLMPVGRTVLVY